MNDSMIRFAHLPIDSTRGTSNLQWSTLQELGPEGLPLPVGVFGRRGGTELAPGTRQSLFRLMLFGLGLHGLSGDRGSERGSHLGPGLEGHTHGHGVEDRMSR